MPLIQPPQIRLGLPKTRTFFAIGFPPDDMSSLGSSSLAVALSRSHIDKISFCYQFLTQIESLLHHLFVRSDLTNSHGAPIDHPYNRGFRISIGILEGP